MGINEFFKRSVQRPDVREGIVGAVAVKIQEPIFESQTKNKLGNTDLRWIVTQVRESLVDALFKNPDAAEALKSKVQLNEKIETEVLLTWMTALLIPQPLFLLIIIPSIPAHSAVLIICPRF